MIFKQWLDVLRGTKTQTRRIGKRVYAVGSVQAVIPKYLQPSIWWRYGDVATAGSPYDLLRTELPGMNMDALSITTVASFLTDFGYERARVRIAAVRQEPVQAMSEADALAEGIYEDDNIGRYYCPLLKAEGLMPMFSTPIECYAALWDSINTKRGLRWQDNLVVNVYTFALAESVLAGKVAA